MTTLVLVGNDKVGRTLINRIGDTPGVRIAIDLSSNSRRVLKLLRKGTLSLPMVFKMATAEWLRPAVAAGNHPTVASNTELLELIRTHRIERVYLFRAGLIINAKVIASGVELLNVHCASIERFPGIGSIDRALKARDFEQVATMHRVTTRIDEGEIIATRPYRLDPKSSYRANEDRAYEAGIELIASRLA